MYEQLIAETRHRPGIFSVPTPPKDEAQVTAQTRRTDSVVNILWTPPSETPALKSSTAASNTQAPQAKGQLPITKSQAPSRKAEKPMQKLARLQQQIKQGTPQIKAETPTDAQPTSPALHNEDTPDHASTSSVPPASSTSCHPTDSLPTNALKVVTFDKPAATSSVASVATNNSNSVATPVTHTATVPTTFAKSIIQASATHSNSPNEQYAESFQRYNAGKQKKSKQPREKLSGGWLTKEEKKQMNKRKDEHLDDEAAAALAYEEGGWGPQPEFDWNAPSQLLDWEGNVLPPPVEWADRHQCTRDNWSAFMLEFVRNSQEYVVDTSEEDFKPILKVDTSHPLFTGETEGRETGDVVPNDWIPEEIDNQTPQAFWKSLEQSAPDPVDEGDPVGPPFWKRLQHRSNMLKPLRHKSAKLEPVEAIGTGNAAEAVLYKEYNAHDAIAKFRDEHSKGYAEKKNKRRLQKELQVQKKMQEAEKEKIAPPPNKHRPTINVYLRPMRIDEDLAGVYAIWEHYAKNTVHISELDACDIADFRGRLDYIGNAGLPLIVAVEKTGQKARRGSNSGYSEKIVGWAVADEDEGRHTSHSHVAIMDVFVHPEYQQKNIGKNLVDRLLWLLDPMYKVISDVRWETNPDNIPAHVNYDVPGGKRVVGTVRAVLYYEEKDRGRCVWVDRWLSAFGFEKQADFTRAGMKLGRWYVHFCLI